MPGPGFKLKDGLKVTDWEGPEPVPGVIVVIGLLPPGGV